jgi:hypothetical protein
MSMMNKKKNLKIQILNEELQEILINEKRRKEEKE